LRPGVGPIVQTRRRYAQPKKPITIGPGGALVEGNQAELTASRAPRVTTTSYVFMSGS
jgi:hypothetical protein